MVLSDGSRDAFLRAVDLFDGRVRAAPATAWSSPSPCEGWTAQDVLAHLVANLRALRVTIDGGDFFASFGQPVEGDTVDAWRQERAGATGLLENAAARSVEHVVVGGNPVPLAAIVDGLMRDLVIHTWDLARAVGGDEHLPDDLVAEATEAMKMVTEASRGPGLYGHEVPAPPGADAQTTLLALSGRTA
jgi:uncharacterized protein (TIGR03086 family)